MPVAHGQLQIADSSIIVDDTQSYHVAWFVTNDVRSDVTVRIRNGRFASVETGRSKDAIDLGSVALVSGLVNAHTHLEFSDLQTPIAASGRFTDWIREVVAYRRAHPSHAGQSIAAGIRESLQAGTTCLGEISTSQSTQREYSQSALPGIVFQEILGLTDERVAQQKESGQAHLRSDLSPWISGISPHAPYSTHLELVREAVALARQTGCPLAMHLAETQAELDFLKHRTGEFRQMLCDFGIWNDDPLRFGRRPMDYLQILAAAPRSLIIHGNFLGDDELQFLCSQPQMTLVYCPRTHHAFGHPTHPWRRANELGIRVALGTDSRASNPDLSLFAELQFLAARDADLSHIDLLQLGSINGRIALGLESSNAANFTAIRAREVLRNPITDLFASTNVVCGTMVHGRWLWQDDLLRQTTSS